MNLGYLYLNYLNTHAYLDTWPTLTSNTRTGADTQAHLITFRAHLASRPTFLARLSYDDNSRPDLEPDSGSSLSPAAARHGRPSRVALGSHAKAPVAAL
jgi:hypothetical protein